MNEMVRWGGARQGNWIWDGCNWVCDPDCGPPGPCPPCPPPGFPPSGCPPWFPPPQGQPPWYPGANAGVTFSQNPPPNPVRGHFWWDGAVLWMFDGASWQEIGGPGVSGGGGSGVVFVGTTPPPNPLTGQQWWNPTTGQLFLWSGTAWVQVGGVGGTQVGVTNGANAGLGMVGEVLIGSSTINFAGTVNQIQSASPLSLTPGDWNVSAWLDTGPNPRTADVEGGTGAWTWGMQMYLNPVPAGASSDFHAIAAVSGATADSANIDSLVASGQINVSATTPLIFAVATNIIPPATGQPPYTGTLKLQVYARRAR